VSWEQGRGRQVEEEFGSDMQRAEMLFYLLVLQIKRV
jgi:hypothetical protein